MSTKERLHQLIDEMNEDQAAVLLIELEEPRLPLTADEIRDIETARAELREGRGIPLEDLIRELRTTG